MNPQLVKDFSAEAPGALAEPGRHRTVATSRADIFVRFSDGEGVPIVLIHEIGGSGHVFDGLFADAFAHDHQLLAIDLAGHGRSGEASDHETAYTVEGYADTLLETLERLEIESAFVLDVSKGGRIGRELLSIFPGALGLIVVGDATYCETSPTDVALPPIYHVASLDEKALEPVILNLELREAALSLAPRLWYGG